MLRGWWTPQGRVDPAPFATTRSLRAENREGAGDPDELFLKKVHNRPVSAPTHEFQDEVSKAIIGLATANREASRRIAMASLLDLLGRAAT